MKWNLENIEKTFIKSCYNNIDLIKIELKNTLDFYLNVKVDNEELENRKNILNTLIKKYN